VLGRPVLDKSGLTGTFDFGFLSQKCN